MSSNFILREWQLTDVASLADKANYAVKMYRKLGFEVVKENEHDYVMILKRDL